MVLDPIKLKSMLPIDGSMEKGFIGELMTPTEASTSACLVDCRFLCSERERDY